MANDEKSNLPEKSAQRKPEKKKKPNRIAKWYREMRSELKKVVWPTPKQAMTSTAIALFIMFAASLVIWGFDQLASGGVQALIAVTR